MTPEETRQAAAVMIAHAEGKRIEFNNGMCDGWQPCEQPVWDWECVKYRVAPERWAGKIWIHENGQSRSYDWWMDPISQAEARSCGWRLIEAKEVEPSRSAKNC